MPLICSLSDLAWKSVSSFSNSQGLESLCAEPICVHKEIILKRDFKNRETEMKVNIKFGIPLDTF